MINMKYILLAITFLLLPLLLVRANSLPDRDSDGVSDFDEINIYHTNPDNADTDGDSYSDFEELNNGFSPHNSQPVTLLENDFDKDGLSDDLELRFKTDMTNQDSDGDGYSDGDEVANGYDPAKNNRATLTKRIEVDTDNQELGYFLGDVRLGKFIVSSGINHSTPIGTFTISNKSPKAWSPYGLWMPYWLGMGNGKYGLHELPIWPNGYREGEDHLGTPVSHGCVRLGTDNAEALYSWTPVGTSVVIY